jgi:hypothetical protein
MSLFNWVPHWFAGFICIQAVWFTGLLPSSAQDTLSNGKALNLPFRRYGLSIGNSHDFNGVRINLMDKHVNRINGLNVTFWSDNALRFEQWLNEGNDSSVINGISMGIVPTAGSMQLINLGLMGVRTSPNSLNGLSAGGTFILSAGNINGLSISGLLTQTCVINGIAVSGLFVAGTQGINGLAIGGIAVSSDTKDINGVAFSPGILYCGNNFKGIGVSGIFLRSMVYKGLALAGFAKTNQMFGLSFALYNRTDELHGIMFGLLNYAGNNPRGLRMLPFVNMHLMKKYR